MSNVLSKYWYPEYVNNKSLEKTNVQEISGKFSYIFMFMSATYLAWKYSYYIPFEF
mgnify:CR=1 FL=1